MSQCCKALAQSLLGFQSRPSHAIHNADLGTKEDSEESYWSFLWTFIQHRKRNYIYQALILGQILYLWQDMEMGFFLSPFQLESQLLQVK